MIVNDKGEVLLRSVEEYDSSPFEVRKHIYEKLELGLLILKIPDKFSAKDRTTKNAYKAGFLSDLYDKVYPSRPVKERYEMISERYHLFYTNRMFISFIQKYKELCI